MSRDFTDTLRIYEIFYSIQGESATVGWPTVFVRLTGCPLRCQYCDTEYAFHGGEVCTIDKIIQKVKNLFKTTVYTNRYITITGGEPLAQKACINLIEKFCDSGFNVSIETSGAFDIKPIDPRTMIVMDLKTPGSGEVHKNLWQNLNYLKPQDQIKFVISTVQDYTWAKTMVLDRKLDQICQVLFSPSYGQIQLRDLAEAILADRLPIRLQTQLHKHIWGEEPGR